MLEAILQLELSKVRHFIFILTCLLPVLTCQARTIIVDDDGPADFSTIQAAIDDANHGDVIVVKPGIYTGDGNHDIHFRSKAITVRSEKGPNVTVIDCANNDYGFGIRDNDVSEARLEGFTIRNAAYGAIRCYSSVLPRSAMVSNTTQTSVAVLYNPGYAQVLITDCVITANHTIGVVCDGHDNVTITNCNISRNAGQGVYSYMSWPTIKNCLVAENGKTGVRATGPTIVNCTIVANQLDGVWAREANVTNSIIWGNSLDQIRNFDGNCIVTYSDVQGGWEDQGNIDVDPLFANPDSSDYHLVKRSPCIDAGDPNYVPQPNETDLDGNPRIINSVIDMGTHEWQGPHILYVDADANGANDGSSWENAYNYLQDALTDADSGQKPAEIRVAQGIYRPDRYTAQSNGTGNEYAAFQLMNAVSVKGGYAGFGQADPNARDIREYRAVLSSDLAGDDVDVNDPCDLLDEPTRSENSWHVIVSGGTDETAVLDGFTITGGNHTAIGILPSGGGGMANYSASPTVANCTFAANAAIEVGGAIYNMGSSSPTVVNCVFEGNYASFGGGIHNWGLNGHSNPRLINCVFNANSAIYGGGISEWGQDSNSSPTLSNCTFNGNSAHSGGGMFSSASPMLAKCIFNGNLAEYGAGLYKASGTSTLTNCTLVRNSAKKSGGAIHVSRSKRLIAANCTFEGNSAPKGGKTIACDSGSPREPGNVELTGCILWDGGEEIRNRDGSVIMISYSDVYGREQGVYDPHGGIVWGPGNIDTDPMFGGADNADYHLKSQAGRWDPNSQSWVQDDVTSPCIDAGDPMFPMGHEPFPNGGIINMGAYGGTAEASKSYSGEPVCETIVAGDINGDCKIDLLDFAILSYHWLEDHRKR